MLILRVLRYIKTFDITKFPSENVPVACLCLKAVTKALGTDALPKNTIHKVLEDFSKLSSKSFNEVCASQIAYVAAVSFKTSLKILCSTPNLSAFLPISKIPISSWLVVTCGRGVGHPGLDQHNSSFNVTRGHNTKTPHDGLPWEEWMWKYAKCTHCSKIGHIHPQCPLYLDAIASGAIKRPEYKPKGGDRRAPKKGGPNTPPHNFLKNPKAKAFLSAFKSFMNDSNDSDEDNDNNKEEAVVDNDEDKVQEEDDEDLHGFLSMIGSLKD